MGSDFYQVGTWLRLWATFAGTPSDVLLVMRSPQRTTYRYCGDQLTMVDASNYEMWLQPMESGEWIYSWHGQGPGQHDVWLTGPKTFRISGDPSLL
jgi:hypothetical protein